MASILVTDGEQRAALAAVRSLGRAGHAVHVCSARRRPLAGASRFARGSAVVPDPLREPDAYAEAVRGLVRLHGVDLLLPMTEASLLALLPQRETLGAPIPAGSASDFLRLCDKAEVMEAARAVGLGVPRQWRADDPAAAGALSAEDLPFPLVLKPARSVVPAGGGRARTSVVHLRDAEALRRVLADLPAHAFPILLQERIVGPGIGVFLLEWEGETLAAFSHRRLREKPPAGGVSVSRESWPMDPVLLERSKALLRAFDWRGVAMVEYKLDAATGAPYVMEINGRFWGSLQLAIDAGVDFPALLAAAALGGRPERVLSYRTGVRTRWSWGEVDHLLARMRHSREALSLPAGAPGRLGAVRDFLAGFGPGRRDEVFRWGDPLPALREAADWLRGR